MSLNRIDLIGRLTREPDLRRTQNGNAVVSFALAVDRDFKNAAGGRDTDFVDCVAWRGTAEFVANYFRRGDLAAVSGRLQSRKWTDKNGNPRIAWEVQVDSVYICGGKRGDSSNTADERDATPEPQMAEAEDDGELPF